MRIKSITKNTLAKICIFVFALVTQVGVCKNIYASEKIVDDKAQVISENTNEEKETNTEVDINNSLIDERVVPSYSASYTDSFMVGSEVVTIIIWIDANQGGVTLTATGDCDFEVEGTVYDAWGESHDFSGSRDQTSACQIYGGCYTTYQQIERIYVRCSASSYDGEGYYEKDIWLIEMG